MLNQTNYRCCILVDSTRGLCSQDKKMLRFLNNLNIEWCIVATKADLLSCEALAQSLLVIEEDLQQFVYTNKKEGDGSHKKALHTLEDMENEEDGDDDEGEEVDDER